MRSRGHPRPRLSRNSPYFRERKEGNCNLCSILCQKFRLRDQICKTSRSNAVIRVAYHLLSYFCGLPSISTFLPVERVGTCHSYGLLDTLNDLKLCSFSRHDVALHYLLDSLGKTRCIDVISVLHNVR